jgi:hypothetical protein
MLILPTNLRLLIHVALTFRYAPEGKLCAPDRRSIILRWIFGQQRPKCFALSLAAVTRDRAFFLAMA